MSVETTKTQPLRIAIQESERQAASRSGRISRVKLRVPADVHLRRAQVVLLLAALVSTLLTTPVGIVLLVSGGSDNVSLIAGILVLSFCASAFCGFVLGAIYLRRGTSLVRMQSDFLSAVSHELRTPMTSIRMFVEALMNDRLTDPSERQRCLTTLRREVTRLDGLVTRLIDLSKIEGSERPFARDPVELAAVCHAGVDAAEVSDLETGFDVDIDCPSDLVAVGDHDALVQVIANLLTNARKYAGNAKVEVIATAPSEQIVEIAVRDHGPGIHESDQRRIFQTFERGRTSEKIAGSGLGLAIVDAIVRAHRGTVVLESAPGQGATFRVRLPRVRRREAVA